MRERACSPAGITALFAGGIALVLFAGCMPQESDGTPPGSTPAPTDAGDLAAIRAQKCDTLKATATACYDGYCANDGGKLPFCTCWQNGLDISTSTCKCMPMNLAIICQRINLDALDPTHFDCARAVDGLASVCAGQPSSADGGGDGGAESSVQAGEGPAGVGGTTVAENQDTDAQDQPGSRDVAPPDDKDAGAPPPVVDAAPVDAHADADATIAHGPDAAPAVGAAPPGTPAAAPAAGPPHLGGAPAAGAAAPGAPAAGPPHLGAPALNLPAPALPRPGILGPVAPLNPAHH